MKGGLSVQERWSRVLGSMSAYLTRPKNYLARAEFWVYLPGEAMPAREELMDRMVRGNPHLINSKSPIGPAEGFLFGDVRTHFAVLLRSRNPHAFRMDHVPDPSKVNERNRESIAKAEAIAKLSFISEQPISGRSHLKFLTHAADSVATLTGAELIYDLVTDRFMTRKEITDQLDREPNGDSAEFHLKTLFTTTPRGMRVETRGLRKIGLPDFRSLEIDRDQSVVVENVVWEAATSVWHDGKIEKEFGVVAFEDHFVIRTGKQTREFVETDIMRVHQE